MTLRIWTIGDERTASTRLRVHQFLPRLAGDGIAARIRTIPRAFVPRLAVFTALRPGDRLLVQKKLFSSRELRFLRRLAGRLLYDVDDAVYLDGPGSTRNRDRFLAVTALADRVLAGNGTLAAAAARPEKVTILPTAIDTDRFRPVPLPSREPELVAWIGSRTNLPNLESLFPVFAEVRRRRPRSRLLVVADRSPAGLPEGASFVPWSPGTEREILGRASIGVMPLDDTPFNRGKCGFKILLYQACGLPVIASPVGVNRELIVPGETGLLAEGPRAWTDALERLLGDPASAARMGARGRDGVERTHAVAEIYPRFRDAVLEGG